MHVAPQEFIETFAAPLAWLYLAGCAVNLAAAVRAWRRVRAKVRSATWLGLAGGFAALGALSFSGHPLEMPERLKQAIDASLTPLSFFVGAHTFLAVLYLGRRLWVRPAIAWIGINASLLFFGASLTDRNFAALVTSPDNVAIVAMICLLAFFLWWAAAKAVNNDRRSAAGLPPSEKLDEGKVLVWPDLVYIELICALLVGVLLMIWSLSVPAPLEPPANPALTPNPAKAPWYFLGLQELLTFSDAWMVGVTVPCLVVLGLAAIPYLDRNPEGNGYYTIRRRRFAYLVFLFGFLMLWIMPILVGAFLRGPNWNFCGLYEVRDPQAVVASSNVKLSEYFWYGLLGREIPEVPADGGAIVRLGWILWREAAGVVVLAAYFLALPPLLARTLLHPFRRQMGRGRYAVMIFLLLAMLTLPLKMILHWTCNLSYLLSMPEYSLNF